MEVNGSFKVDGKVTSPTTGTGNILPVAFGKIGYDGYILSGMGNFTVSRNLGGGPYYVYLNDDKEHIIHSVIINNNTINVQTKLTVGVVPIIQTAALAM
ncbi:hypothetical protein BH10BAC3_BH10BAC3_09220 [soil metagenome]